MNYPSIIYNFTIPTFLAPSGLTVTSIGDKQICLSWVNNSLNDDITVYYRKEAEAWQVYQTVSNITNSICVTGLSMGTLYTFEVFNNYGAYSLGSGQVQATTTVTFLPAFCSHEAYFVTNTSCGNSDGRIEVNEDYTIFYNFILTDIWGTVYTLTDYYWTGLTAGWYQIQATVLPKWWYYYGVNEQCYLDWIPLYDTDTTITLDDTKIKNAVCGGFGGSKGRIVYEFTDSATGATSWTFTLFNDKYEQVNQQSLTGISTIVYAANPDIYYGILESDLGCTYLIDLTFVDAEQLYTVGGIQRLFVTPWNIGISYNYFDSTSEDWYVTSIDTQSFTSTKIKEYLNLSDFWYEIKLDTATMSYGEALQKDFNGLTYRETITISIPKAENSKWKQLSNILTQRYMVIFQDNHDQWWTCFYRWGAEVKSYSLSENQYVITLIHPSVNKMLAAIDYNYVKLNCL